MPEIGFTLRTLLDDGDEFKVEFLYQINQDQPWSWIGKVTCNGENLTKKVKLILFYFSIKQSLLVHRYCQYKKTLSHSCKPSLALLPMLFTCLVLHIKTDNKSVQKILNRVLIIAVLNVYGISFLLWNKSSGSLSNNSGVNLFLEISLKH